jgi:hypothetical protein
VVAVLQGIGFVEAFQDTDLLTQPWTIFVAILTSDATLLLFVYLLLVRRGAIDWHGLGLRRGASRHPILAGVGYGVLFLVVSATVSTILAWFGVEQDQARQFPLEGAGPLASAAIMLAGVVFAPIAEEIFFRGFIFQAMSERKGLIRGVVYSSALFAAVHANVAAFLPLAAGAAVLAYSFRRTGTLWAPITAHAVNNLFALALLLTGGI